MQNEGSTCRRERASWHRPGWGQKKDKEVTIPWQGSEPGFAPLLHGQGSSQAMATELNLVKRKTQQNALGKTTVSLFTDTFDSLIVIIISAFIWLRKAQRNL